MIEHNFSPLASSLIETPPSTLAELLQHLEDNRDAMDSNQIEIAALRENDQTVAKLLEGAGLVEKVDFLHPHLEVKEGGDFLQLWTTLDELERTARAAKVYTLIKSLDNRQIAELVDEMKRIPEVSEGVDFPGLQSGFEAMRDDLISRAEIQSTSQFAFSFLRSLVYFVMGRIECASNFWEILLLKLEQRFLPDDMHPETSPLFPCFRIAANNLLNQPALHEFCLLSEEVEDAAEVAANIACLAFVHTAPSNYRRSLLSDLDAEFFFSLKISGPFSDPTAPWRSALHNRLERSFSDLFVDTADRALELQRQLSILINESGARAKISQTIAADLSQGMKAGNVSKRLEDNCQHLMNAAACSRLIGASMIEAKDLFIPSMVSALGIGPRVEIWRKHSQLLSRLAEATKGMESALDWSQISRLFSQLDERIQNMQARPIHWLNQQPGQISEGLGLSDEERTYFTKLGELTAARIAIDERRYGSRWKKTVRLWLVETLFSKTAGHDFERAEACLERFFNHVELEATNERPLDVDYLKNQAQLFSSGLLQVASASALYRASHQIATLVADEVIEALPEYGKTIGVTGRDSCISDNRITLQKVTELMLESDEDPAEQLTEWWTSLVGSYLATRPERLFELNLNAIYRNINKHLSDAHTDLAFSPIQAMYNESLGVSCVEALASRPLAPVGRLAEAHCRSERWGAWDDLLMEQPSILSSVSLAGVDEAAVAKVGEIFFDYHVAMWREGSADLAAARVLPKLNRLDLGGHTNELAANLRLDAEALAPNEGSLLLQFSAESFSKLILRQGIAEQMETQSAEIAQYFSEAMITYAPEFFEHLSWEDAVAKCSRDQVLLIRKIAQFLKHSTPELAWFDLTRYFLELQSAFVDYPERIWAMSFRTLSKALGKHLSAAENLEIVEIVDVAEHLAGVWSGTQELAKYCFDPTDYTFSAKADKDLLCRDLLTAVLVGDAMNRRVPDGAASFFHRFFLSSELAVCDEDSRSECFASVRNRSSDYLSPQQLALLDGVSDFLEAFVVGYEKAANNLEGLAATDRASKERHRLATEASVTRDLPKFEKNHSHAVVNMMLRAHLASGNDNSPTSSVSGCYSTWLNAALISYFCAVEPKPDEAVLTGIGDDFADLGDDFIQGDFSALHLVECARAVYHSVEAAKLISNCEAEASKFLKELVSGDQGAYNEGGVSCKNTTDDGFAYIFKTAAAASMQPQLTSPKLFFSRASENHRWIDLAVSSNAHAKTCLRLSELLPSSGLAAFAPAGDLVPVKGASWYKVAYTCEPCREPMLEKLDDSTLARIFASESAPSASLSKMARIYVAELRDHGDWEAALARISLIIDDLLVENDAADAIVALQAARSALEDTFDLGAFLFWSFHFELLERQLQQVALGRLMATHTTHAVEDYVKELYPEATGEDRMRCLRDQTYLLTMTASAMRTLGPAAALQNVLKAYAEYVLPHLKNNSQELSHNWAFYENWFMHQIPVEMHPETLAHFGLLAEAFGRSPKLKHFVGKTLPGFCQELAGEYNLRPYQFEDFMTSLCGASLASGSTAIMLAERVLLGSPVAWHLGTDSCKSLFESLEAKLEANSDGRVPNMLKSVVMELPAAHERMIDAADASGSNLSRFCIANPHSNTARALWKACNVGRYSLEDRSIEPDRNDAKVARAFGIGLLEEEDLGKELSGYRRFIANLPAAVYPEREEEKRGGLLGLLGGKKRDDDAIQWRENSAMRKAVEQIYQQLVHDSILGFERKPLHLLQRAQKQVSELSDPRACVELHEALLQGLEKEQGASHGFIELIRSYVRSLPTLLASKKLLDSSEAPKHFYGLYLAGLRNVNHGPSYFRGRNPDSEASAAEALIASDANESSAEKIRSASAEITELFD